MANDTLIFLSKVIQDDLNLKFSILNNYHKIDDYIQKLIEHATIISIRENGQVIGAICFYCNNQKDLIAYVSMIAVHIDHRGKGIGDELLSFAIANCRRKGFELCKLEVNKRNVRALTLYSKNDFSILSESENTYLMQKKL
ncbi:GNAT family N-acetyltransferase [Escherichia coli]|nr:GNAT family N-acetyltransferase [Escherichia coli]